MTKEEKAHLQSVIEGVHKDQPPEIRAICYVLKSLVAAIPPLQAT